MRGNREALAICVMIWDKCQHFKNHYIYPSQETWLKWLTNQGVCEISRRTFNRWFRKLQNSMQINRIRRVKHHPIKGMLFLTTLYSLNWLGIKLLVMNGVISREEGREYLKNSIPFKARVPKKQRKGISPGEPGFYKDFTSYGEKLKQPG